MAQGVLDITDSNFEAEVLNSAEPVLVDFWAPWCPPCRAISPMIQELATEYAGVAKVGKLNTDESTVYPHRYGVMTIPTLIIFKGGEIVDRFMGIQPKGLLQGALDAAGGRAEGARSDA